MFEAEMPNIVVPETSWGQHSFGLADKRTVEVQIKHATQELGYPVWGLSPSSTADDSGNYAGHGVEGQKFPTSGPAPPLATRTRSCHSATTVPPRMW
jgi:hypothetical protein